MNPISPIMDRTMNGYLHQPLHIEEWVALLLLAGIVGGIAVAIVAIITEYFRHSARDEMDATLKMEMLNRGMSADEIIKVLRARSAKRHDAGGTDDASSGANRHSYRDRHAMREAMRQHAHGD